MQLDINYIIFNIDILDIYFIFTNKKTNTSPQSMYLPNLLLGTSYTVLAMLNLNAKYILYGQ